jgi:hypothetical protein
MSQEFKRMILESIVKTIKVKKEFDSATGKYHIVDYQVTFKIPIEIRMGTSGINDNTVAFSFRHKGSLRVAKPLEKDVNNKS